MAILEAALIVYTVKKLVDADKNEKEANKINLRAFEKAAEAQVKVDKQEAVTNASLLKLINRKKGILNTSINSFLQLYSQIIKIDFQSGDGIKELEALSLTPAAVGDMHKMAGVAGKELTMSQTVATFLFTGIPGLIAKESEMNLSAARMRNRQANVVASHAETVCIALDAIAQRADRISDLLAKMNLLFIKSLENTSTIIEVKGPDRSKYSRADKEGIMVCMNFASAIKKVLDTPLLDRSGEITQQSFEAIQTGEEYLKQINQLVKL